MARKVSVREFVHAEDGSAKSKDLKIGEPLRRKSSRKDKISGRSREMSRRERGWQGELQRNS